MMRSSLLLLLLVAVWSITNAFLVPSTIGIHQKVSIQRINAFPVEKSDDEWRALLDDDDAYHVLREKGTEPPFSSEFNNLNPKDGGILLCKACGAPLFSVSTKYDSGTGWPSFFAPLNGASVKYEVDFDAILPRTECLCSSCGSHLGHVFEDGPAPTSLRYCMNGITMKMDDHDVTSTKGRVIQQQQQDPVEATRLPLNVVLPTVLTNLGVAALMFASYWTKHDIPTTKLGEVLVTVPLPFAAFFAFTAVKSIVRAKY